MPGIRLRHPPSFLSGWRFECWERTSYFVCNTVCIQCVTLLFTAPGGVLINFKGMRLASWPWLLVLPLRAVQSI